MKSVNEYTLADPSVMSCPFDYHKAMRAEEPVHFDEEMGIYIVSKYADIMTVLAQPLLFSSELGFSEQARHKYNDDVEAYYKAAGLPPLPRIVTSDPPYHTRIRSLMDKAFTAHRVASMESAITEIANGVIDGFVNDQKVELVGQFAIPLPIYVIADQLGIPRADLRSFKRWSDATVENIGRNLTRERAMWCAEQLVEMWRYLEQKIAERRTSPADDMISDLVHARVNDPENPTLSVVELNGIIRALIIAGNETTTTAIGNGLLILMRNGTARKQLFGVSAGEDRAVTRMVEEILRLESPVQGLPRVTTKDTELGGQKIPKGALVFLGYASANRDDAKFDAPEIFNLERKNVGQHLAFGSGIHRCIGSMLARMEIKVAMRQIFTRLDDVKLAVPEDQLAYVPNMLVRTLVSLPVTFTRRRGERLS